MFSTRSSLAVFSVVCALLATPSVQAAATVSADDLHTGAPRQIIQQVPVPVPGPERIVEVIREVRVPSEPRVVVRERVVEVPGPERVVEVEKIVYRDRPVPTPIHLPDSGPGLAIALLAGGLVGGVRTVRKAKGVR